MGNPIEFATWLTAEMERRGLTVSDVAVRGDISPATISRIMNTERNPGPDACIAIARALDYPPEAVFRIAGLLPDSPDYDTNTKQAAFLFDQLPDQEQENVLIIMRALLREKVRNYVQPKTKPSES